MFSRLLAGFGLLLVALAPSAWAVSDSFNTSLFDHGSRTTPRGTPHGDGVAIDLSSGQRVAVEYNNGNTCLEILNGAAPTSFLLPTNTTNIELSRFTSSVGTSVQTCQNRYTSWDVAALSCPANMPCGTTETVSRQRQCERSIGRYVDCSECGGSCYEEISCSGDTCGGEGGGGGDSCFPGSVKITMADGSLQEIASLKAGDMVLGFSNELPQGPLAPVAVSYVKITPSQEVFSLNDGLLEATADHPIMLEGGEFAQLSKISLGDRIITENGDAVEVTSLAFTGRKEVVYNLVIEDGRGFIAEGVRVREDLPNLAEMTAYMTLRQDR